MSNDYVPGWARNDDVGRVANATTDSRYAARAGVYAPAQRVAVSAPTNSMGLRVTGRNPASQAAGREYDTNGLFQGRNDTHSRVQESTGIRPGAVSGVLASAAAGRPAPGWNGDSSENPKESSQQIADGVKLITHRECRGRRSSVSISSRKQH